MSIKTLAVSAALAVCLLAAAPSKADTTPFTMAASNYVMAPLLTHQLPMVTPAPRLAQSVLPTSAEALLSAFASSDISVSDSPDAADNAPDVANQAQPKAASAAGQLRQSLVDLALTLRDIRYVHGGRDPSTGFDCSGFVRYVFSRALGLHLPTNSAHQFLAGLKVKRADMKAGDLVFFRTAGRNGHGRVSHVGMYINNGKFIHAPTTGETVRVDSLDNSYWSKRFAGAKRPKGLAHMELLAKNG